MYPPSVFQQHNTTELLALIETYPFGTLITHSNNHSIANHIPFTVSTDAGGQQWLKGHIARNNPLWEQISEGKEVLVIFNGPNCYISPNHYPSKADNGKAVPTWNYAVAHIQGNIFYRHEKEWIYQALDELTQQHEGTGKNAWTIDDAPDDYIEKLLAAVVGIEISIRSISGIWKLSQNQPEKNYQAVLNNLLTSSDHHEQSIAQMMLQSTPRR